MSAPPDLAPLERADERPAAPAAAPAAEQAAEQAAELERLAALANHNHMEIRTMKNEDKKALELEAKQLERSIAEATAAGQPLRAAALEALARVSA